MASAGPALNDGRVTKGEMMVTRYLIDGELVAQQTESGQRGGRPFAKQSIR